MPSFFETEIEIDCMRCGEPAYASIEFFSDADKKPEIDGLVCGDCQDEMAGYYVDDALKKKAQRLIDELDEKGKDG